MNHLTIGSPDHVSEQVHLFMVRYKQNELILQTPRIQFFDQPKLFGSHYYRMSLCFYNHQFDDQTQAFLQAIDHIENQMLQQSPTLWKNVNLSPQNKKFISSIKYNEDKSKAYMSFDVLLDAKSREPIVSVFDADKKQQPLNYIEKGSSGYAIIMLQNVWQKGKKMGLNWVLLQTKVYKPLRFPLNECMIQDTPSTNESHYYCYPCAQCHKPITSTPVPCSGVVIPPPPLLPPVIDKETHPIFGKFVKMKRMGVPDGAIQSKCMLEGVSFPDFSAFLQNNKPTSSVSPTSLPIVSPVKLTANMLTSITLKKPREMMSNDTLPKRIKIEAPNGFQPPSAKDLLSIISRLKKTESSPKTVSP